jgi:hypothetical protein
MFWRKRKREPKSGWHVMPWGEISPLPYFPVDFPRPKLKALPPGCSVEEWGHLLENPPPPKPATQPET